MRQRETLVALFPGKQSYKSSLLDDLGSLANSLISLDRSTDAEDRLRERLELQRELTDDDSVRDSIQLVIGMRDLASLISKSGSKKKVEEAKELRAESEQRIANFSVEQVMATELSNGRKLNLLSSLVALAKNGDDLESLEGCYRAKINLYQDGVKKTLHCLADEAGWPRTGRIWARHFDCSIAATKRSRRIAPPLRLTKRC